MLIPMNICLGYVFSLLLSSGVAGVISEHLHSIPTQQYASCKQDVECNENAFCYGSNGDKQGKCKCVLGFEMERNSTHYQCLRGIKLGEPCETYFQCKIAAGDSASCNASKVCDCDDRSYASPNGQCYVVAGLGDVCMNDFNCHFENGKPGLCHRGICECSTTEILGQGNTICMDPKVIGQACYADEECVNPNTRCEDVCRCDFSYVLTRNNTKCIKAAAAFGEACEVDSQCSLLLTGSVCSNETCACEDNHHQIDSSCYKTRQIGESCEEDNQCAYDSTIKNIVHCQEGVCTCSYGTDDKGFCKKANSSYSLQISKTILISGILGLFFIKHKLY